MVQISKEIEGIEARLLKTAQDIQKRMEALDAQTSDYDNLVRELIAIQSQRLETEKKRIATSTTPKEKIAAQVNFNQIETTIVDQINDVIEKKLAASTNSSSSIKDIEVKFYEIIDKFTSVIEELLSSSKEKIEKRVIETKRKKQEEILSVVENTVEIQDKILEVEESNNEIAKVELQVKNERLNAAKEARRKLIAESAQAKRQKDEEEAIAQYLQSIRDVKEEIQEAETKREADIANAKLIELEKDYEYDKKNLDKRKFFKKYQEQIDKEFESAQGEKQNKSAIYNTAKLGGRFKQLDEEYQITEKVTGGLRDLASSLGRASPELELLVNTVAGAVEGISRVYDFFSKWEENQKKISKVWNSTAWLFGKRKEGNTVVSNTSNVISTATAVQNQKIQIKNTKILGNVTTNLKNFGTGIVNTGSRVIAVFTGLSTFVGGALLGVFSKLAKFIKIQIIGNILSGFGSKMIGVTGLFAGLTGLLGRLVGGAGITGLLGSFATGIIAILNPFNKLGLIVGVIVAALAGIYKLLQPDSANASQNIEEHPGFNGKFRGAGASGKWDDAPGTTGGQSNQAEIGGNPLNQGDQKLQPITPFDGRDPTGELSRLSETGSRKGNYGSVGRTDGKGNWGAYQMTEESMNDFLGKIPADKRDALLAAGPVGSKGFNAKWKEIGPSLNGEQDQWLKTRNYDPMISKLNSGKTPLDFSERGQGLKEILHSTATQMGPALGSSRIRKALAGKDISSMSDEEIIQSITESKKAGIGDDYKSWIAKGNNPKALMNRWDREEKAALAFKNDQLKQGTVENKNLQAQSKRTDLTPLAEQQSATNDLLSTGLLPKGNILSLNQQPNSFDQTLRNMDNTFQRMMDRDYVLIS